MLNTADLKYKNGSNDKLLIATILLAITLITVCSYKIYSCIKSLQIPFDTDEADHANAAIELYYFVQNLNLSGSLNAIIRQAFYPPLHSIFVCLAYLINEPSLTTSRIPSLVSFILAIITLLIAIRRSSSNSKGYLASTLCLLLLSLSSPLIINNSALCMLELPGVLMVSLCILISSLNLSYINSATLLGVFAFIVTITKYNFGISIPPAIATAFLIYGDRKYSEKIRALTYSGLVYCALFALWYSFTDRSSLIHFFIGHPSYTPMLSTENLFFDVKSWFNYYSITPLVGMLTIIMATYGAFTHWYLLSARFTSAIVFWTFTILLLTTTNEIRHSIVAAPAIWYLAALGTSYAWQSTQKNKLDIAVKLLSIICAASTAYAIPSLYRALPTAIASEYEGKPHFEELQQFIAEHIAPNRPAIISGNSDNFSLESIRWHIAARHHIPYSSAMADPFPYNPQKANTALKRKRNIDRAFLDKSVTLSTPTDIINTNYYSQIVLITSPAIREKKQLMQRELIELYQKFKVAEMEREGLKVIIYDLERKIHSSS